jgi:DNA-binding LytR/AlgR family response regulator
MSEITVDMDQFKELVKIAIVETLQEQREAFTEIITEAMEDIALVKAIEEGESTETVDREAIFKALSQQP